MSRHVAVAACYLGELVCAWDNCVDVDSHSGVNCGVPIWHRHVS